MKAALLLNGAPYGGELPKDRLIYCCDGAYRWAKGRAEIYKNIGDFDSLDEVPYPAPEEVYPSEKDFTDGEIALRKMIEEGADDIEVYGAFGVTAVLVGCSWNYFLQRSFVYRPVRMNFHLKKKQNR